MCFNVKKSESISTLIWLITLFLIKSFFLIFPKSTVFYYVYPHLDNKIYKIIYFRKWNLWRIQYAPPVQAKM